MDFNALLALMVQKNSFDLFITAGRAPTMKIDGVLVEVAKTVFNKEQTMALVLSLMEPRYKEEFHKTKECQFAISVPNVGHFRVSAFIQRDFAGMVLHRIRQDIPDFDSLNLPKIIKKLVMEKRGLILFAGALGSGKSTSLASSLKYRNQNSNGHIIILDDPMKFMHAHIGCIVTQREVGLDTESYTVGLKNALQQSANVVSIGEIQSREVMQSAFNIVDSGQLCLSTLTTNNAEQTVERILNFFPDDMQRQVRLDLATSLSAIISQQILRCENGQTYVVAEILIATPEVKEALRRGEFHRFKDLIINGRNSGMQSFDQARCDLFMQQKISYEDALESAEYKNEFRMMVKKLMENTDTADLQKNTVNNPSLDTSNQTSNNEQESKRPSAFESSEITLSDIYDDSSDAGSIFTHR
ncbi:MAG: PilT/PilU family type 4a pilus ATPase [Methylococcaceae bacterium]